MSADTLAAAAEAIVGSRFRLHGRDPATGLDCIGVLTASLAAIGRPAALPTGYALRTGALPDLSVLAKACGFGAAEGPVLRGDVLFLRVGPCQHHLAIAVRGGCFVHAHAGLRRVVIVPAPLAWPVIHHWRLL